MLLFTHDGIATDPHYGIGYSKLGDNEYNINLPRKNRNNKDTSKLINFKLNHFILKIKLSIF